MGCNVETITRDLGMAVFRCIAAIASILLYAKNCVAFICASAVCAQCECKAVVGGPAGPAMAGPLFRPKMVSAGPQISIIRPKMCLSLKCGGL